MPTRAQCRDCAGAAGEIFARLLPDQRSRLTSAAVLHAYGAGEVVFHEGTPALAVYCVRSGSLKLFRRADDGDEIVIGTRNQGALVGLRAVLAGLPYWVTAMTLEPASVCTIPGEIFLGLVRENPVLAFQLLKRLACEYRITEELLVERKYQPVGKRTARFLARLVARNAPVSWVSPTGEISMNREEMARLIGTTPETLSRTLHLMAAGHVIELTRKSIRVRDAAELLKLAE